MRVGAQFLLLEMKTLRVEGVGRILLGDNTAGGVDMPRPLRFLSVADFLVQGGSNMTGTVCV
jgi:hypothetical protein